MKTIHFLVLACILTTTGCDSTTESATDVKDVEPSAAQSAVADSPEAVFAQFKSAMEAEDWETAVTLINRESQEMMIAGMVMQAAFMTMEDESKGKELEAIFTKHGLDALSEEAGMESLDFAAMGDKLPAFVGDLSDWVLANDEGEDEGFPEMGELANLTVDGDKASATVSTEMGEQPIEFQKVAGQWKMNLATGPPAPPSIDELGLDFDDPVGEIGSLQLGDDAIGLNHAFAYRGSFFDEPCVVLVLSVIPVSEEKREELKSQLAEDPENAMFFAEGANVTLTLSPQGELMSMFAWINNSSISGNRGPAVDIDIEGDKISGRVGMAPEQYGDNELQFIAKFETDIAF